MSYENIVTEIKKCCMEISHIIHNGNSSKLGSSIHETNKTGDEVKKIDLISNELLRDQLMECSNIYAIGSEEEEELVKTGNEGSDAKYLVCYDPLDGSSNVDVNITVGTIFAIYEYDSDMKIASGRNIVCAGYCLYGGSTQFIIAHKSTSKISMYTLRHNNFVLLNNNLRIPSKGNIYAINESNKGRWLDPRYQQAVDTFIADGKTQRWVASLVADAHRTLIKGGFFSYPPDKKNTSGRIRLLYEAYPFAFIFAIAGGCASTGQGELLDVAYPEFPHQKTGIILSSPTEFNQFLG